MYNLLNEFNFCNINEGRRPESGARSAADQLVYINYSNILYVYESKCEILQLNLHK